MVLNLEKVKCISAHCSWLISFLFRLLRVCIHAITEDQPGLECCFFKIILDCVKSILRVFLNLTHDNGKLSMITYHVTFAQYFRGKFLIFES